MSLKRRFKISLKFINNIPVKLRIFFI
jgi:hypothetical protein